MKIMIVLSNIEGTMTAEWSYFDYATDEEVTGTTSVTFGTKVLVEPLLFSSIEFSYSTEYATDAYASGYPVFE